MVEADSATAADGGPSAVAPAAVASAGADCLGVGGGKGGCAEDADKEENLRASRQRTVLMVTLVATASLLLIVPSVYCGSGHGAAQLAANYRQGAHSGTGEGGQCDSCHGGAPSHHGALETDVYAGEVLRHGISGLLLMVANVLAGIGADIPGSGIFAMGTSSLVANALAMGFSKFLDELARTEFALGQLELERHEVRYSPDEEIDEMVCHYQKRGLTKEDAERVSRILSKYEDFWVRHMMVEELGIQLPREGGAPYKSGLVALGSFAGFGIVPLLGVIVTLLLTRWLGPQWYRPEFSTLVSLVLSAAVLCILGVLSSWLAGSQAMLWHGLVMLACGCTISACAFVLGLVSSRFGTTCCMYGSVEEAFTRALSGQVPVALHREGASSGGAALLPEGLDGTVEGHASRTRSASRHCLGKSLAMSSDDAAWPFFRGRFLLYLGVLWIGVSSLVVCSTAMRREMYQSLRVFAFGWLTCITTALGVLPFAFVEAERVDDKALALANTAASGMMISASVGMLHEAHGHCGPGDWQIFVGLLAGGVFMRVSERILGDDEEASVEALHGALVERQHLRKAMLIFTVMFCHSAAEGIAVGVAFDKQLQAQFGLYISLLLAVHNMPEGLAVALVLVPRGVSTPLAACIALLTSVPQPLLALAAFLFVDAFQCLLPLGLSFAAGAMVFVSVHELLLEAVETLGRARTAAVTVVSFVVMVIVQHELHRLTDA